MASDGPSPHSPSLRLGLPAPQTSRRHHAQSMLGPLFFVTQECFMFLNPDPSLSDLADMGAGVSTDSMRVAGALVGIDDWVKTCAAKMTRAVITDVAKLDVATDGLIHTQLLKILPKYTGTYGFSWS